MTDLKKAFFEAIASVPPDMRFIIQCLDDGYPLNEMGPGVFEECMPLHHAVSHGQLELVDLFLKHGADRTIHTNFKITPLHSACGKGSLEMVERLLVDAPPGYVNAQSSVEMTALIYIAERCLPHDSFRPIAEALINAGARTDIKDYEGKTAEGYAREHYKNDLLSEEYYTWFVGQCASEAALPRMLAKANAISGPVRKFRPKGLSS